MKLLCKKWVLIHIGIVSVIALLFAGMTIYTCYVNHQGFTIKVDELSDYTINLDRSKEWSEKAHGYLYGMQYDVTVNNHTFAKAYDWEVALTLVEGCHVDSYWNGEVVFENDVLTLTPLEHINDIPAGGQQTFGFVLYSDTLQNVLEKSITVHMHMDMQDLPLFWATLVGIGVYIIADIMAIFFAFRTRALQEKQKESLSIINQSLLTFANMIDAKDPDTKGHSLRVAVYSKGIAKRMGIGKEERQKIYYIALLHDIGKIGIQDNILKKEDKLTPEENELIEKHVRIGGEILKDFNAIPGIAEGAKYHHERYDGEGYVFGLKGKEIPLYARIIGIADAFDAMSTSRCYREALPMEEIVAELKRCSGTQFDPEIVPYMLELIAEKKAPVEVDEKRLYRDLDVEYF